MNASPRRLSPRLKIHTDGVEWPCWVGVWIGPNIEEAETHPEVWSTYHYSELRPVS